MKNLQRYLNNFELEYRKFEHNSQRRQISTTFKFTIEGVFETLETADVDMSTYYYMIDPIFNRKFGNTFHHQNGKNQRQHAPKNTGQYDQSNFFQIPSNS